jgi:hypothetical protein
MAQEAEGTSGRRLNKTRNGRCEAAFLFVRHKPEKPLACPFCWGTGIRGTPFKLSHGHLWGFEI